METPRKYPRTYHWITSPGVSSDDKVLKDTSPFLNIPLVITEKLDGGNCSLNRGKVYARSTGLPTCCPSFDFIKANHAWKSLNWSNTITAYGENMFAEHSIPYNELSDFYYVFGVKEDGEDSAIWYSWEELQLFCMSYELNNVPPVAENIVFQSEKEVTDFLVENLNQSSFFGSTREGFVIRTAAQFNDVNFAKSVCKYVRKNHVQTDTHWSKNWIPNKMIR